MKTAKHTPGPWATDGRFIVQEVEGRSFWPGQPFIADCAISGSYKPDGTTAANARLIAAAPDLLEACKRALPWVCKMIADGGHKNSVAPNDCIGAMEQLGAAIDKATIPPISG